MVVNHVKQLQSSIVVATPFDQQLNIVLLEVYF